MGQGWCRERVGQGWVGQGWVGEGWCRGEGGAGMV